MTEQHEQAEPPNTATFTARTGADDHDDMAKLFVDLSLIEDDYDFWRHGGRLVYAVDFNVVRFCVFASNDWRLSRLFHSDEPDTLEEYANAIARILISALTADFEQRNFSLCIMNPHHEEYISLDGQIIIAVEELALEIDARRQNNETGIFSSDTLRFFESLDPDQLTHDDINGVVAKLRKSAPDLLRLFRRDVVHAVTARNAFDSFFRDHNGAIRRGVSHDATTDVHFWRERLRDIDPAKKPYARSNDARALAQLGALNRTAATGRSPAERYLLLSSDTGICAAAHWIATQEGPSRDTPCHVRHPRLLPFMAGFHQNSEPDGRSDRFVSEMANNLRKHFGIEKRLPLAQEVVKAAYPRHLANLSESPTSGHSVAALPGKHGVEPWSSGRTFFKMMSGGDGLGPKISDLVLNAFSDAKTQLQAAVNLIIAQSPPNDPDLPDKVDIARRLLTTLRNKTLQEAVDQELMHTLDRAAHSIGLARTVTIKNVEEFLIKFKARDFSAAGRMPFVLRDPEGSAVAYFNALAQAVQGNAASELFRIATLSPFTTALANAYIFGMNDQWREAEGYCHNAIQLGAATPDASVEEAHLLLALAYRRWQPSPDRFQNAFKAMLMARNLYEQKRQAGKAVEDLRFEAEFIAQALTFHNCRYFLSDDPQWQNANQRLFPGLDEVWQRLHSLVETINRPDWHDTETVAARIRNQIYLNVCGYWLFRWLWLKDDDKNDNRAGHAKFQQALTWLEGIHRGNHERRSTFARIAYCAATWYRARGTKEEYNLAQRALHEIRQALAKGGHLLPYEEIKYQSLLDKISGSTSASEGMTR